MPARGELYLKPTRFVLRTSGKKNVASSMIVKMSGIKYRWQYNDETNKLMCKVPMYINTHFIRSEICQLKHVIFCFFVSDKIKEVFCHCICLLPSCT